MRRACHALICQEKEKQAQTSSCSSFSLCHTCFHVHVWKHDLRSYISSTGHRSLTNFRVCGWGSRPGHPRTQTGEQRLGVTRASLPAIPRTLHTSTFSCTTIQQSEREQKRAAGMGGFVDDSPCRQLIQHSRPWFIVIFGSLC